MASTNPPPRSARLLLVDRTFGPFFFGKITSMSGNWMQNIAAAVLLYDLTGSATLVGAISVLQFLPQVFLAPVAGAWCDRVDRRRLLLSGIGVALAASTLLTIYLVIAGTEAPSTPVAVLASALGLGLGFAIVSPATHAVVPGLVPRRDLTSAIGLTAATSTVARAIGPAIAAVTYAMAGPVPTFAVAAGSHLVYLIALIIIHPVRVERARDSSVMAGLRYLRRAPRLVLLLLAAAVLGFTVDPVITLTPPLAEQLGHGEQLVGGLASAFGVGAVVALPFLQRTRQRMGLHGLGLFGFALLAVGFLVVASAPNAALALLGMVGAGAGFLLAMTSLASRIQHAVDEDFRGRVMALWGVGFLGSRPVAGVVNGLLSDHVSTRLAIALSGVLAVAVLLLLRSRAVPTNETP